MQRHRWHSGLWGVLLLVLASGLLPWIVQAFTLSTRHRGPNNNNNHNKILSSQFLAANNRDGGEETVGGSGNEENISSSEDWRAFRAKLVQQAGKEETGTNNTERLAETSTNNTPSSWTYDAGSLIEVGSVVVSKVESDLGCHDLRQPYFAKCLILIVEHDPEDFTQGIILNRPSNLQLQDDEVLSLATNNGKTTKHAEDDSSPALRLFFGGDIASLYEEEPLIVCLHNLTDSVEAQSVSDEILPGIFITSHYSAVELIEEGEGTVDDFVTFYGFCGWDPGQLELEIDRGSWCVASMDAPSLWKDLTELKDPLVCDPRSAGLSKWEDLMTRMGKAEELDKDNAFADLMLKEWTHQALMNNKNPNDESDKEAESVLDDATIFQALRSVDQRPLLPGSLLCGSSAIESPFLLKDQFLHQSIVLSFQEEDQASVGMILNLPTMETFFLDINENLQVEFPVRYGGPSAPKSVEEKDDAEEITREMQPLIWLHCSAGLKYYKIGKPLVTENADGVWTCSVDQVVQAIDLGFGDADDFLLVQGFCLWEKTGQSSAGGLAGQLRSGNLQSVDRECVDGTWTTLRKQKALSVESLSQERSLIENAWKKATTRTSKEDDDDNNERMARMVFDSSTSIRDLADQALEAWMKIYLLGDAEYYME